MFFRKIKLNGKFVKINIFIVIMFKIIKYTLYKCAIIIIAVVMYCTTEFSNHIFFSL